MIITSHALIDIEKCFKVEAGPGAGKTEFLINHIKNVLHNSKRLDKTRKIACITYTNVAAQTIVSRLGKGASNRVEVSTIHSFLYKHVVRPYLHFISSEYDVNLKKVRGHDDFFINRKYVYDWLDGKEFEALKGKFNRKSLKFIFYEALKEWLLSIRCTCDNDRVFYICDNKKALQNNKNQRTRIPNETLLILSNYLLELKKIYWKNGKLDHNDILFFSYILIEKYPFILEILRAKFPYIYVDEYQDTNPIQTFILERIREKETIVGVIGDRAQSIYSFQGAMPTLFDSFHVDANCEFTIEENHRSTKKIISLLNAVRSDIMQKGVDSTIEGENIVLVIGDRNDAFRMAYDCCGGVLQSLSRDNTTANALKKDFEETSMNTKLLNKFEESDSDDYRRQRIWSFIQAVELSFNNNYKEALKKIEWIFSNENNSRKAAIASLSKLLLYYKDFCNKMLIDFYHTICSITGLKLTGFREGNAKKFYDSTPYKSLAICVDIVDDTSSHITIHKAKGAEYDNVIVFNDELKSFLLSPNLQTNEEHRIIYVALSRARKRLFLYLEDLSKEEEKTIKTKYKYIKVIRL